MRIGGSQVIILFYIDTINTLKLYKKMVKNKNK
jgi:hypothetical protein